MTTTPPVTPVNPAPGGSTAAWLFAQAIRFGVPFAAAFLLGSAAKVNLHFSVTEAYLYVTGGMGAVLSAVAHYAESKWAWARRILLAKKPGWLP